SVRKPLENRRMNMASRLWLRRRSRPPSRVRLSVEALEARLAPAGVETVWKGPANGTWSVAANWTNGVPGAEDTAKFDGSDNNDSKMDLSDDNDKNHIGKLKIDGYSGTIKLSNYLVVDVLEMASGKIQEDPGGLPSGTSFDLSIQQSNASKIIAASSWTGGEIGTGQSGFIFRNIGTA